MAKSNAYLKPEALARITRLELRANQLVEGTLAGQHRSPMHGVSIEFADYREYSPGDDLKRLDWRVYARSNRYYIKEFEVDSNLRATIVVDASASMKYQGEAAAMSKYDYAATVAASLAMLLIKQRDAAGLLLCDHQQREYLPPAATRAQLSKILDLLEATTPANADRNRDAGPRTTDLGSVLTRTADRIKGRGMIIVISDLLTDLDAFYDGLGRMQHRGHDVLLLHVMDRDELELPFQGSVRFHDLEGDGDVLAEPQFFRTAYQQAIEKFSNEVATRARLCGMDYLLLPTDAQPGLALSHYLHRRQTQSGPRQTGRMSAFHRAPGNTGGANAAPPNARSTQTDRR